MKKLLLIAAICGSCILPVVGQSSVVTGQVTATMRPPYTPCSVLPVADGCIPGIQVVWVDLSGDGRGVVTLMYTSQGMLQSQSMVVDVNGADACIFILPADATGLAVEVTNLTVRIRRPALARQ